MRHVARHAINSLLANGFNGSYTVLVYEQDGLYSAVNPFGDVLFSGADVVEVEEFALNFCSGVGGTVLLRDLAFDYSLDIPEDVSVVERLNGLDRVFINSSDVVDNIYTISMDINSNNFMMQDSAGRYINDYTTETARNILSHLTDYSVLYIKNNVYLVIDSTWELPNHFSLYADEGASIIGTTGVTPVILLSSSNNVYIEGLTIQGYGDDEQICASLQTVDNVIFNRVNFRSADYGTYINSQGGNKISFQNCTWTSMSFDDSACVVINGANQVSFDYPHMAGGSTVVDRKGTAVRFDSLEGDAVAQAQKITFNGGFLGYFNTIMEWNKETQGLSIDLKSTEFECADVFFKINVNQNYNNYITWTSGWAILDGVLAHFIEGDAGLTQNSGSIRVENLTVTGTTAVGYVFCNTIYVQYSVINPRSAYTDQPPTSLHATPYCTSTFYKNNNTTPTDVTGMVASVYAGHTYKIYAHLIVSADAAGGHKYSIGGTATKSALTYDLVSLDIANKIVILAERVWNLNDPKGEHASGATGIITTIDGYITIATSGTLTIKFAQNNASGISNVGAGSYLEIIDTGIKM